MNSRTLGVGVIVLALLGLVWRRASAGEPERTGVGTMGPVEQVGPTGNTTPLATPDASTAGNQYGGITLPNLSPFQQGQPLVNPLEACAPLNSFGRATLSRTWDAWAPWQEIGLVAGGVITAAQVARSVTMTAAQVSSAGLDPSKVWKAADRRTRLPVECAR